MSEADATTSGTHGFNAAALCFLCAIIMAFGWGYRGVVGHEGGAMLPGAMLGMAICLASGRQDWYRRAAVAGLFAAVGWAWGGSLRMDWDYGDARGCGACYRRCNAGVHAQASG